MISESLKTNTTLTTLDLYCDESEVKENKEKECEWKQKTEEKKINGNQGENQKEY